MRLSDSHLASKLAAIPLALGGAAALGALGRLRRFKPAVEPELAALQRLAKDKPFEIASHMPETSPHQPTTLHHYHGTWRSGGGADINVGELPYYMSDKYYFHKLMTDGVPGGKSGLAGAVPRTELLEEALGRHGGDLGKLRQDYGGDFVIKHRNSSLTRPEDLLTTKTPPDHPLMRHAVDNPGDYIVQEKLKIKQEYRIHLINNVPYHVSHRQLPKPFRTAWEASGGRGGAFVPVLGKEGDAVMDFARKATSHIGSQGDLVLGTHEHFHHGLDVARLEDGSLKVIESNALPQTLQANPVARAKLERMVTGRRDLPSATGLAVGIGTGVALGSKAVEDLVRARQGGLVGHTRRLLKHPATPYAAGAAALTAVGAGALAARDKTATMTKEAIGLRLSELSTEAGLVTAGKTNAMNPYQAYLVKNAKLTRELKEHQNEAIRRVVGADGSLLIAHGTGTGKTSTSVGAVERLRELGKAHTTLVITPAALRDNFIEGGVKKFTDQTAVRLGPRGEKGSYHVDGKLPQSPYYITSIEMFRKDPGKYLKATGADTMVVDELHKGRDQQSANYHALLAARPRVRNFIGLTGTPVMNHPRDIVPTLDLVTNKRHGLGAAKDFDARFTLKKERHAGMLGWAGIGPEYTETVLRHKGQLKAEIGKHVHYVPSEDVADMPTKQVHDIDVPMSHHQQKLHQAAIDRSHLSQLDKWRIEHNLPVNQRLAMFYLAQLQQARQASNAMHPFDHHYDAASSAEETPKVKRLLDDVSEHLQQDPKHQAIISTHFVHGGVDTLSAGLHARHIPHGFFVGSKYQTRGDRDAHVKDYLAGKRRVMIINQAGTEGLNLNNTTAHYTLDPHYNPESVNQIEARGIRADNPASEIPVYRYRSTFARPKIPLLGIPLAPRHAGTDEWIYNMMSRKTKLNDELLALIHEKPKQRKAATSTV